MATFALFYSPPDLTPLAAAATDANLSGSLRTTANRLWNGGLSGWSTAPIAPAPWSDPLQNGDANCRIVVISGAQVSKAIMIDWLNQVAAANPNLAFMRAIALDMAVTAVEPWPPP